MHLYDLPLIFILVGLVLYTVLGGADFGAGFWQLMSSAGPGGARVREYAHHAMAPVWEANHVWLVFVLTVTWTAYPTAFGSIASTLSIPLFIAAVGIILRGASYAVRAGTSTPRERARIDLVFAVSSILTPFALGTIVGAIASQRVPVGNAAGDPLSSWLNPTSILVGVLAVASAAYLAAVYLAADATRVHDSELERLFRNRALIAGVLAGAVALAGIAVLHEDAHPLYHRLLDGEALVALSLSILSGIATLGLVARNRFELARYSAALAVAAVIAGWAFAQSPVLLRGLTVQQAAAPHDTLVAVVVAVLAGAVILFPSLALLFRLLLHGRLDSGTATAQPATLATASPLPQATVKSAPGLLARLAGACLVAGVGFLTIAEAAWAHALGVLALLGFISFGFLASMADELRELIRP
jgi:cytochrome d ubiquinol oxidase subunit II